ncbi:aspartate/glutamate racemase family protein [Pollutimonas sp. M17]|uniref:aspartate/glutamate racemase family protein n=1 Tax=Pollutimonas sp. M17 TaxID=2962065 RepID=UPI0021F44575|nr:aspartate/glutamate racemase family protein [Pollutimonas sp. M17]UYO93142.1 aspartate/glutamate racemase family protein [Pollutimonas sp. M17]
MTRIALIHAVYAAIDPVTKAFGSLWPQASLHHLIDDGLPGDLEQAGHLTDHIRGRIRGLADLGLSAGADGILFTCSAFANAIEDTARALPIPVLKPDEAMFSAALQAGRRIGLLATFPPAADSMVAAFHRQAEADGIKATLETVCVPEAMVAARAGDTAMHNRLVVQALPQLEACDVIMLAHFSTSTALSDASAATKTPVLSAPQAAVLALKEAVEQRRTAG